MAGQGIRFEDILSEKHSYWRNLMVIFFVALIIAGALYFLDGGYAFTQTSSEQGSSATTSTIKAYHSLIEDESYIQTKINEYLDNNPSADVQYARDNVYMEIARLEKNPAICDKIVENEIKYFCSNAVR